VRSRQGDGRQAVNVATPASSGVLPLTGERTVPGIDSENYWIPTVTTGASPRQPGIVPT